MSLKLDFNEQISIEDDVNCTSENLDFLVEILNEILPVAPIIGTMNHTFIIITENKDNLPNVVGSALLEKEAEGCGGNYLYLMVANFKVPLARDIIKYLLLHEIGHINTNGGHISAIKKYRNLTPENRNTAEAQRLGEQVLKNELDAERFAFENLELLSVDIRTLKSFFEEQIKVIDQTYKSKLSLDPIERISFIKGKIGC